MPHRIRVNIANQYELLEVPGLGPEDVAAIVRFRRLHGPIADAAALSRVLGGRPLADDTVQHVDFDPADQTAPEAPGA